MALFGKKKEAEVEKQDEQVVVSEKKAQPAKQQSAPKLSAGRDLASVIIRPRITEKAAVGMERNVYTFEIHKDATKFDVRDAIKELYKVTPVKVNIVKKSPRHYVSRMRGRSMTEKGLKKAYVYLKEGDRIDLI